MKNLFLITFVLGVSLTFTIDSFTIDDVSCRPTSSGCSNQRLKLVNQSIQGCFQYTSAIGAFCVQRNLYLNTNQQKWNVMVQEINVTQVQSSYWFYNDCSVKCQVPGPASLAQIFTIWKATLSPSQQYKLPKDETIHQRNKQLNTFEHKNEDCTPQRSAGAYYALNYCQNNNSSLQVICIKNNMMTRMGQKWDAVTYNKTGFGIRYDYYNGCNLKIEKYGSNNRNYLIWKAQ